MTTLFFILIISVVFMGVVFLLLKGKPGNHDPQETEEKTAGDSKPAKSMAGFLKKKKVFQETLKTTLNTRTPIIPTLQIPPPPENFIGRKHILSELFAQIKKGSTLIGLYGNSGVGKTALGLTAANRLSSSFPDEPLYMELRGFSAKPLGPDEIMTRIINFLSPHEKYPETESKRTQLYQTLLKGRKSVLFFDNVPGGLNLTHLIPPKNCVLIATSAQPLSVPQLSSKKLNAFDTQDAQELLMKISPRTGFWVSEIAKMCNNFPLALCLFAKYMNANTQQDASQLMENLGAEMKRLKPEARADEKKSLELVLTLSYRSLPENAAAVLRKLVLFPDTFDDKAEAFLCEDPDSEYLVTLLTTLGMVTTSNDAGRFSLHDRVRRFLTLQLQEPEKLKAEKRFATYFLTLAISAGELYSKEGKEKELGLNLFDLEWDNIKKGQAWAHSNSDHDQEADNICLSYTEALIGPLGLRQSSAERIKWFEAAFNSSKRLNEPEAENKYLLLLGVERNNLNQFEEAVDFLEKALRQSRESNDKIIERKALEQLGTSNLALGKPHRAIEFLENELDLLRKSEEGKGEEVVLENLGRTYFQVGENSRALEYFKEGLRLAREQKNSQNQGRILGDIGKLHSALGEHENAIESFEEGLTLVKKSQNKKEEIILLGKLGDAYRDVKKFKQALGYYQRGLELAKELKDQKTAALTLEQMGQSNLQSGSHREAASCFRKAMTLFQKTGDKAKEGEILWRLAQASEQAGKIPEAIQLAEAALVLFQKIKRLNQNTRKTIENQLKSWKAGAGTKTAADPGEKPAS